MLEGCTPFPAEFAERYVREGIWRRETIPQAIAKAAQERPDSIAVIDSTRSVTYSQLIAEAGTLAALLSRNGIVRNDRVIVQLPNCVEFATLTLACLEIGAIPVMALPAFRKAELEYLVSFSDAKAIAIAPEYRGFDHAALARDLNPRLILSTTPAAGCVSMHETCGFAACDWIFGERRSIRRRTVPAFRRDHRSAEADTAHSRGLSIQRARVRRRDRSHIRIAHPDRAARRAQFPAGMPRTDRRTAGRCTRRLHSVIQGCGSREYNRA